MDDALRGKTVYLAFKVKIFAFWRVLHVKSTQIVASEIHAYFEVSTKKHRLKIKTASISCHSVTSRLKQGEITSEVLLCIMLEACELVRSNTYSLGRSRNSWAIVFA